MIATRPPPARRPRAPAGAGAAAPRRPGGPGSGRGRGRAPRRAAGSRPGGSAAGGLGHVGRDVGNLLLGELTLERWHRAPAVRDAVDDEVEGRLRLVAVRPDGARRARGGELVAGA